MVNSPPPQVFVRKEDLSLDVIKQHFVECPRESDKEEVLKNRILPACDKLGQTIVFVKQRKDAKRLHMALHEAGWKCTSISGGKPDGRRRTVVPTDRLSFLTGRLSLLPPRLSLLTVPPPSAP